ncbi:MAG: hypothetical protein COX52_08960 [Syntrophobacterales bacterium CG23_combo_of_CG06-09_8_20_14_all_48_27]|nr:MAG: hypothetical protein COX52_08960 [Syntrophobacterales bacterium CG23_combo_of_CG06-09_8_20_14_all_48_27]
MAGQQKQLEEKETAFLDLVMKAYRAEKTEGFAAFHGKKAGWLMAVKVVDIFGTDTMTIIEVNV